MFQESGQLLRHHAVSARVQLSALQNIVGNPFEEVYPEALQRFQEFSAAAHLSLVPVTSNDFVAAIIALRASGQRLPAAAGRARTEFVIRRLLGVEPPIDVLLALKDWLDQAHPLAKPGGGN